MEVLLKNSKCVMVHPWKNDTEFYLSLSLGWYPYPLDQTLKITEILKANIKIKITLCNNKNYIVIVMFLAYLNKLCTYTIKKIINKKIYFFLFLF